MVGRGLSVVFLTVLDDREFQPVGATKSKKVNAKIVFATNKDFAKMVSDGHFMPDLYQRFKRPQFWIPPLRTRKDDIPLLVPHFVEMYDTDRKRNPELTPIHVTADCMELLKRHDWPGNVRELQLMIRDIMIDRDHGNREDITSSELPTVILETKPLTKEQSNGDDTVPFTTVANGKKKLTDEQLILLMKEHCNNKSEVARVSGYSVRHVRRRCKPLNL